MSTSALNIPASAQPKLRLPHVPELDGLRGLAALAVFCHHVIYTSIGSPELGGPILLCFWRISRAGAYGVDLFFVLSGFLITSIILIERDQPHFYWNFYCKRALRIFPLYAVSLMCLAALLPSSRPYVALSALFIANFAPAFHVVADGPFWTLAIEEQFYTIWPQFAKRLTVERLQQLALVIVAACLLLRLGAAAVGHHNFRYTFYHCDGLALGAILACQSIAPPPPTGEGLKFFRRQRQSFFCRWSSPLRSPGTFYPSWKLFRSSLSAWCPTSSSGWQSVTPGRPLSGCSEQPS